MEKDIAQILLSEEQIQNRIRELGEELSREYADKNPVVVGVLKGFDFASWKFIANE